MRFWKRRMEECALWLTLLICIADNSLAQNTFFAGNPGDMIYRGTTAWQRVPGGTAGQLLQSNGPTAAPTWTWGFGTYTTSPFVLPAIATNRALMNVTGGNAAPTAGTQSQFLDTIGYDTLRPPATGAMVYKDGTTGTWQATTGSPGTGYVMTMQSNGVPAWLSAAQGPLSTLCTTSGAFPIYNATTGAWVCSTIGGTGSIATLNGGPLTLNPTALSTTQGLVINQTGPQSGTQSTALNYNYINVVEASNLTGGAEAAGLYLIYTTGASNALGQKIGASVLFNHGTASATGADFIALQGVTQSSASQGGTNTGAGAAGTVFGIGLNGHLASGATNFFTASGGEVGAQIDAGASAKNRLGWSIISYGVGSGAVLDTALEIGANGAAWGTGVMFSSLHGASPVKTTGTLIGTDSTGITVTNFIDFSTYACTGNQFKGASSNFLVDCSANIQGRTLTLNAAASAGLSINDGTVTATFFPSTDFTHSFEISTSSNHNLVFRTNATIAGYFDTSQQFNLGVGGVSHAVINLNGFTSGTLKMTVQDVAGTPTVTWGTSSGTPAVTASSPLSITAATGNITCATCATTAGANIPSLATGDILYASAANTLSALADVAVLNVLISGGVGVAPSWGKVALGALATQATNTVVGNATSGSAVPTALAVGSCSTASSALIWTTNTGFGCNASITAAAVPVGGITGLGTGVATWLATPSSANLASAVTDETGSGALVFAASPTLSGTVGGAVTLSGATITFSGNTGAGSSTTGTIVISGAGGLGVGGAIYSAGNQLIGNGVQSGLYLKASGFGSGYIMGRSINADNAQNWFLYDEVGTAQRLGVDSTGNFKVYVTTTSVSKTTGSLINAGGFGNSGTLFTDTLNIITVANASTTAALCWNSGTGLVTENGAVGTCTVSDERLKNMGPRITGALDKLLKINGVYFTWKDPLYGKGQQIGVGAQTVARVFPELVHTDGEGKLSADYQRLVAPIIEALRELKASNDNFRTELDAIKQKVAR